MTRLLAPVLLAACFAGAASGADESAAPSASNIPEIPGRYDLPNVHLSTGAAVPPGASMRRIRKALEQPRFHPEKLEALKAWHDKFDITALYKERGWRTVDATLDLLDKVLDQEKDARMRRLAVYYVFGVFQATVRDAILFRPSLPWWPERWERIDALRRRCLKDRDPKLREFFERYEPLEGGPDWRAAKAQADRAHRRLLASRVDLSHRLQQAWDMVESIETSQLAVMENTLKLGSYERKDLSPGELDCVLANDRSIFEHRVWTIWANLYPRVVVETAAGKADPELGRGLGIEFAPVKLGWHDFRPLLPRSFIAKGLLESKRGRAKASAAAYGRALELDPENAAAKAGLAALNGGATGGSELP